MKYSIYVEIFGIFFFAVVDSAFRSLSFASWELNQQLISTSETFWQTICKNVIHLLN